MNENRRAAWAKANKVTQSEPEAQNVTQLALEAGNSPGMIFKHYRELVTPEEAGKWFSIMPGEGYPKNTPYYKPAAVGKKRTWRNLIVPRMKHDELAADRNKPGSDTQGSEA